MRGGKTHERIRVVVQPLRLFDDALSVRAELRRHVLEGFTMTKLFLHFAVIVRHQALQLRPAVESCLAVHDDFSPHAGRCELLSGDEGACA